MITDKIPAEQKEKIRILIVEDNALNQKLAAYMIRDWGFTCDVCENGRKALEQMAEHQYDLVLMDIQMPEMNGYETTRYIRSELKSSVPIIATTAHASGAEKKKCLEAGMTDYLIKPIRGAELNDMLVNYLFSTIADLKE
jgi:CheY-like chemotaxis protein